MQNKHKKNIIDIMILLGIATTIVALFVPIISNDFSEIVTDQGFSDPDVYWKTERSLLYDHLHLVDAREQSTGGFHIYRIFKYFNFRSGDAELIKEAPNFASFDLDESGNYSTGPIDLFTSVAVLISIIIFLFLAYTGYKSYGIKKTYYFLIVFIGDVLLLLGFLFLTYTGALSRDLYDYDFVKYIHLSYGFYLGILSMVIFLTLFLVQSKIIKDFQNKDKTLQNN